jgi:hypothetical protein
LSRYWSKSTPNPLSSWFLASLPAIAPMPAPIALASRNGGANSPTKAPTPRPTRDPPSIWPAPVSFTAILPSESLHTTIEPSIVKSSLPPSRRPQGGVVVGNRGIVAVQACVQVRSSFDDIGVRLVNHVRTFAERPRAVMSAPLLSATLCSARRLEGADRQAGCLREGLDVPPPSKGDPRGGQGSVGYRVIPMHRP